MLSYWNLGSLCQANLSKDSSVMSSTSMWADERFVMNSASAWANVDLVVNDVLPRQNDALQNMAPEIESSDTDSQDMCSLSSSNTSVQSLSDDQGKDQQADSSFVGSQPDCEHKRSERQLAQDQQATPSVTKEELHLHLKRAGQIKQVQQAVMAKVCQEIPLELLKQKARRTPNAFEDCRAVETDKLHKHLDDESEDEDRKATEDKKSKKLIKHGKHPRDAYAEKAEEQMSSRVLKGRRIRIRPAVPSSIHPNKRRRVFDPDSMDCS